MKKILMQHLVSDTIIVIALLLCYWLLKGKSCVDCIDYSIQGSFPHDTQAFTEGLILEHGFLYESTGLYGKSRLIKTKLNPNNTTKKILQRRLPKQYYGEGITIIGDNLYQLTYQSKTGFVYDKHSLKLKKTFHYYFEGWGLTTDGENLIASDGTNILHVLDPLSFKEIEKMYITYHKKPVKHINELEYIHGKIFANIWPTHFIVIIDPKTKTVVGAINLMQHLVSDTEWANGIAYDNDKEMLLITGKYWSKIYKMKVPSIFFSNLASSNPKKLKK